MKEQQGRAGEVFGTFLKLGLTSFGGPIAHLGYFRRELVERRQWVTEAEYGQLLALCQFLPGPASSQLGFALGMRRAGLAGALCAFVAFTLPSALLMLGLAMVWHRLGGPVGEALVHGLKLVALVVVAQGVVGMRRQLCPDPIRMLLAVGAAIVVIVTTPVWVSLLLVALGGMAGVVLCRTVSASEVQPVLVGYGRRTGGVLLILFGALLVGLPWFGGGLIGLAEAFYRAGALVFGGGHVVLPLLEGSLVGPGWVTGDQFLAGYGAAQVVPGPMFSLSSYLGAQAWEQSMVGALVALAAMFLPGFLLLGGVLPFWSVLARKALAPRVIAGVNAVVVGLLGAALYDPIWVSAILEWPDFLVAASGLGLLLSKRVPVLAVVGWCVGWQVLLAFV